MVNGKMKKILVAYLVMLSLVVLGVPAFSAQKININTAGIEQLTQLTGIGPATAQKIIEYRLEQPFKTVDDLTKVSGIGDKTLEKLRDQVTVGEPKQ